MPQSNPLVTDQVKLKTSVSPMTQIYKEVKEKGAPGNRNKEICVAPSLYIFLQRCLFSIEAIIPHRKLISKVEEALRMHLLQYFSSPNKATGQHDHQRAQLGCSQACENNGISPILYLKVYTFTSPLQHHFQVGALPDTDDLVAEKKCCQQSQALSSFWIPMSFFFLVLCYAVTFKMG